jgi:hypothetical protein
VRESTTLTQLAHWVMGDGWVRGDGWLAHLAADVHDGGGPLTDMLTRALTGRTHSVTSDHAADEHDERGPLTDVLATRLLGYLLAW